MNEPTRHSRPQTPEEWKALRQAHGGEIPPLDDLDRPKPSRVVVVGIDISFGKMVELMIQLAVAAIPAALILALIYYTAWAFLTSVTG